MGKDNVIAFTEVKKIVEAKRELDNDIKIYRDDIIHDINVTFSIGAIKEEKRADWRAYLLESLQKFVDSGKVDMGFLNLKARLLDCLVYLVDSTINVSSVVKNLRTLCTDDDNKIDEEKYKEILKLVIEYSPRGDELKNYVETYGLYGNLLCANFSR